MGRMFLGRIRASEPRAPQSGGGASTSHCRNRMFEIDTRTENRGARQSAGNTRGA